MKIIMMKKKLVKDLVGGLKKNYKLFFIIILFYKPTFSSQIYDYQTDRLIELLNSQILSVNNYNKDVNFKIIKDDFPNAFVTEDNSLYLTSGLLIHSPDYVSLLAVLAHEIGHIEKFHITKRKNEINKLEKINSLGNLAVVAGSMLIQEPELIKVIAVNQTSINNLYLNFSQEQEKEADLYAVETLNKLNLPKESVKKFLLILENKTKYDLVDDGIKRFSTHPLFKERHEILNYKNEIKLSNFNQNIQNEFNFIKAKFMAYTNNNSLEDLNDDGKIYYLSIKNSLSGNLMESLKKINFLISKYNENYFLIETKADILLSYGYNKEAIEFYEKVLNKYPQNNYIKFQIFINSNFLEQDLKIIKNHFDSNLHLINLFPNNNELISKYYNLSKLLNNKDWILFFEILLFQKNNYNKDLNNLYYKTKDYNLKKLIKMYI